MNPIVRRMRHGAEDGIAIVEIVVVMFIMTIVTALVYANLDSVVKTTTKMQTNTVTLADARTAVEAVTRDLRAANPVELLTPVSRYDSEVAFTVYCSTVGGSCPATRQRRIVYRVVDNRLERTVGTAAPRTILGPFGSTAVPQAQRPGAIVNPSTRPVFSFVDNNGAVMLTSGSTAPPPTTFRDCVRAIVVHLRAVAEPRKPSKYVEFSTKVEMRNYSEVAGC